MCLNHGRFSIGAALVERFVRRPNARLLSYYVSLVLFVLLCIKLLCIYIYIYIYILGRVTLTYDVCIFRNGVIEERTSRGKRFENVILGSRLSTVSVFAICIFSIV